MADSAATVPPDSGEAATPWLFRYRSLLFGLTFAISALLCIDLDRSHLWPRTPLDRFTALDPGLWLGRDLSAPAGPAGQLWLPVALVAICFGLRSWGTSYLRGHVMADKAMHSDRLIVAGPFRWVRNPLYLGNLFMAAAFGMLLPPPGLVLILLLQVALVTGLSHVEGKGLRRVHGSAYAAYASKVHAFLPRPPRSGVPDSPVAPDWSNGLWTESWHVGFMVYLAGIALRNGPVLVLGALLTLATVVRNAVVNRRARRAAA